MSIDYITFEIVITPQGNTRIKMIDSLKLSLWEILFNDNRLSAWCGDLLLICITDGESLDYRLKRWIICEEDNFFPEDFNPDIFGYKFEVIYEK